MTLNRDDKKALSTIRFEKAEEFLEDAKANLAEGRLRTAVNGSYYASLNAVRGVLVFEGVDPKSHAGAVTALGLRFIRTGLLEVSVLKAFKALLSRRADVDYGDFETIDKADAEESVAQAECILASIDSLRRKMIDELYQRGLRRTVLSLACAAVCACVSAVCLAGMLHFSSDSHSRRLHRRLPDR